MEGNGKLWTAVGPKRGAGNVQAMTTNHDIFITHSFSLFDLEAPARARRELSAGVTEEIKPDQTKSNR